MSSTTNSSNLTQRTMDFRQKYKTQRCRYWYERGYCPFNESCAFAHHSEELRGKTNLNQHYKTKVCVNFKNFGSCKYGERCQFLHLHEAPTVYSRSQDPLLLPLTSYSEKHSNSSDDCIDDKHQKNLDLLSNFGLDLLSIKKQGRGKQWRQWIEQGVDYFQADRDNKAQKWRDSDFQSQFPDYDFTRKPRLGSM